jgi:RimJ/RimL family protein N-acetyltransferase
VIETPRLVLRRPEPGDAAAIERQLADPEVMRYIGRGETGTYTDAVEQVAKMLRAWEQDGFGRFVVVRRETGAVIGRVGLLVWHPLTWRNGTRAEFGEDCEIELGWTLERAAWGRGFATEAATAARDWSFAELRLRRLISLIHAENTRSVRIAQRLDGRYERDVVTARGVAAQLWTLASPS